MIKQLYNRLRLKWRRWQLYRAYRKIVRVRDGMTGALTGIMATWYEMEKDGLITVREDGVEWHWPEDQ